MARTLADVDEKNKDFFELWGERPWDNTQFREAMEISWIYHDNALEGVVLAYEEIKQAVDGQIDADGRLVPSFQEIVNYRQALLFVRERAEQKRLDVGLELVKDIHTVLVDKLPNQVAGRYRKDTPLHRSYYHDISPPEKISYQMRKLVDYVKSPEYKAEPPIVQAARVHHKLMAVFPFPDISGKVARLLMNLQLMHKGYLPAIIPDVERQQYYEALRGDEDEMVYLLISALDNALGNALKYYTPA